MIESLLESAGGILARGYRESLRALAHSLTHPSGHDFFWLLVGVSLFFWAWEILRPWRAKQGAFRRDFWLDGFYMFFNMFLFPVLGFAAFGELAARAWTAGLAALGRGGGPPIDLGAWPVWAQLLVLFVVRDFTHWNVHINTPQMHIWHHAYALPAKYGVNFGLSLSLWDYLFGSAYMPRDGRDEPLGFAGMDRFPGGFFGQMVYPFASARGGSLR